MAKVVEGHTSFRFNYGKGRNIFTVTYQTNQQFVSDGTHVSNFRDMLSTRIKYSNKQMNKIH